MVESDIAAELAAAQRCVAAGRLAEAEAAFRALVARAPAEERAWEALARLALKRRRAAAAIEIIGQARLHHPPAPKWHLLLARAHMQRREFPAAHAEVKASLALEPKNPEAFATLGRLWLLQEERRAARNALQIALRLDPNHVLARVTLVRLYSASAAHDEALALAQETVRLAPGDPLAHYELGLALSHIGAIEPAVAEHQRAADLDPGSAEKHTALLFLQHAHPDLPPAALLAEAVRWRHRHADPLRATPDPWPNDRDPERPLRIGYVSPDFRGHASSHFVLPLLAHHDHSRHHITAYASVEKPDAVTPRFQSLVDQWRDISQLDDEAAAAQIRADRIDVLVELGMQVSGTRLLLFARKPAPVQVAWMGFPGTTGLDTIDYLLTDPRIEPPAEVGPWSTEQPFALPDAWCCYSPEVPDIPVGECPARRNGYVTFGSPHRFNKVGPRVLALWARVLAAVPDSRLQLRCPPGAHRREVLAGFAAQGVAESRIEFVRAAPRTDYLDRFQSVDIVLDAFPYNGHTTTCDGLWMGVPVLTLEGRTMAGRMGLSLLHSAGLADWVARSPDEFVRLAVAFSSDVPALARLRESLRPRLQASPLMDAPRFARAVENAYRTMWRRWCAEP